MNFFLLFSFAIFLIIGFITAEALLDYLFAAIFALAATAIINNIIHLIKYYRKHRKVNKSDIGGILGYLLMGLGAWLFCYIWL